MSSEGLNGDHDVLDRSDLGHARNDYDPDYDVDGDEQIPIHPIPAMQAAFEESIQEAADGDEDVALGSESLNAEQRRRELLDYPSWSSRWKQKSSARCHPIDKLMSQIIFGLHLLQQRQAKSEAEVVKILQIHVDEIDSFLEKTTDDFDIATKDIEDRVAFLRLPMSHIEVFEQMLDDRQFRTQLIEGNDKIESIIERTAKAMHAGLHDVHEGIIATQQLAHYLDSVRDEWPQDTADQSAIFMAMKGNDEGWHICLRELQDKGHQLEATLVQLGAVVGEMNRFANAASRRNRLNQIGTSSTISSPANSQLQRDITIAPKLSVDTINKPLPQVPDAIEAGFQKTIPISHDTVMKGQPAQAKESGLVNRARKIGSKFRSSPDSSPVAAHSRDLAGFFKDWSNPRKSRILTQPQGLRSLPSQSFRDSSKRKGSGDENNEPYSFEAERRERRQNQDSARGNEIPTPGPEKSRPHSPQTTGSLQASHCDPSAGPNQEITLDSPHDTPQQGKRHPPQRETPSESSPHQESAQPVTVKEDYWARQAALRSKQAKKDVMTPHFGRSGIGDDRDVARRDAKANDTQNQVRKEQSAPQQEKAISENDRGAVREEQAINQEDRSTSSQKHTEGHHSNITSDTEHMPDESKRGKLGQVHITTNHEHDVSQKDSTGPSTRNTRQQDLSATIQGQGLGEPSRYTFFDDSGASPTPEDAQDVSHPKKTAEKPAEEPEKMSTRSPTDIIAAPSLPPPQRHPDRTVPVTRPGSSYAPEAIIVNSKESTTQKRHIPFDHNVIIVGPNALSAIAHRQDRGDAATKQQVYSGPLLIPEIDSEPNVPVNETRQVPVVPDAEPAGQAQGDRKDSHAMDPIAIEQEEDNNTTASQTEQTASIRSQRDGSLLAYDQALVLSSIQPSYVTNKPKADMNGQEAVSPPARTQSPTPTIEPDLMPTFSNRDRPQSHRTTQDLSKSGDQTNKGSFDYPPSTNPHQQQPDPMSDFSGFTPHVNYPEPPKNDGGYTLLPSASTVHDTSNGSRIPPRAPSRLGLFPDLTVVTTPNIARVAPFEMQYPRSRSPTIVMKVAKPGKSKKLARLFKRKNKNQYAYVSVSPQ